VTALWRALLVVCALGGCRPGAQAGDEDSGATGVDAGADAHEAGGAAVVDAAPPPDDSILPPPSEELTRRARHLLEAIAQDDTALASDMIFPRDGWLATRDAPDPGKDWNRRVVEPFRRAVDALARRKLQPEAQTVSLELGRAVVQATPRRHGWKKPLWTVRGSRLTFVAAGHTRTLAIREMVAWRGAWYVTRLR
jgi:hypothetical protein